MINYKNKIQAYFRKKKTQIYWLSILFGKEPEILL